MATTNLSFTQDLDSDGKNVWTAEYTSAGNSVVQLSRSESGRINIFAYMDGMTPYLIYQGSMVSGNGGSNILIEVGVMAGMKVRIKSYSAVIDGKLLTED